MRVKLFCPYGESILNNNAIGMFDSGVGGLSCLPAMARLLPNEKIIYFGDTARAPYGSRPDAEIISFSLEIAERLVARNCKYLAIACNTISCIALDDIKEAFPGIAVSGIIEPAAELIAKSFGSGRLALIATEATVKSGAYPEAVKRYGGGAEIFSRACPEFVPLIEAGRSDSPETERCVKNNLDEFIKESRPEALILGCTHFPFIAPLLKRLYPGLPLIDPAEALAEKSADILRARGLLSDRKEGGHEISASLESPAFTAIRSGIVL